MQYFPPLPRYTLKPNYPSNINPTPRRTIIPTFPRHHKYQYHQQYQKCTNYVSLHRGSLNCFILLHPLPVLPHIFIPLIPILLPPLLAIPPIPFLLRWRHSKYPSPRINSTSSLSDFFRLHFGQSSCKFVTSFPPPLARANR